MPWLSSWYSRLGDAIKNNNYADGKCPDGMTLIPWQTGNPVVWDVTVICTTADSYVEASARESGAAAETAATC